MAHNTGGTANNISAGKLFLPQGPCVSDEEPDIYDLPLSDILHVSQQLEDIITSDLANLVEPKNRATASNASSEPELHKNTDKVVHTDHSFIPIDDYVYHPEKESFAISSSEFSDDSSPLSVLKFDNVTVAFCPQQFDTAGRTTDKIPDKNLMQQERVNGGNGDFVSPNIITTVQSKEAGGEPEPAVDPDQEQKSKKKDETKVTKSVHVSTTFSFLFCFIAAGLTKFPYFHTHNKELSCPTSQ